MDELFLNINYKIEELNLGVNVDKENFIK